MHFQDVFPDPITIGRNNPSFRIALLMPDADIQKTVNKELSDQLMHCINLVAGNLFLLSHMISSFEDAEIQKGNEKLITRKLIISPSAQEKELIASSNQKIVEVANSIQDLQSMAEQNGYTLPQLNKSQPYQRSLTINGITYKGVLLETRIAKTEQNQLQLKVYLKTSNPEINQTQASDNRGIITLRKFVLSSPKDFVWQDIFLSQHILSDTN